MADGRAARRSASRAKIATAFRELVREGDPSPSAKSVADRAGVGLRTVFRCFEDLESLYREVSIALRAEFLPRARIDYSSMNRAERLHQMLTNRTTIFGDMEPFQLAAAAHRHRYESLKEDHRVLLSLERDRLRTAVNPDGVLAQGPFEAMCAATSFDYWRRLRIDQGLSKEDAAAAMIFAATAILEKTGAARIPIRLEGNAL
ncbi:TetR/AcrR family transcriptional regulator [Marinicauda algicola]|uniref:TetR/AcrR family transcriptional regulator n=1 Tax=Marinicauda algicola TaxID=2029849 RepID=A0A4S2GVZ0_9PROT|nr:TetR/AcrR family transcriptional regulator [Marinicauda algicola]TGY87270.1 TetR/AcrR family transcriptional regulator [Marinicauda algicola]